MVRYSCARIMLHAREAAASACTTHSSSEVGNSAEPQTKTPLVGVSTGVKFIRGRSRASMKKPCPFTGIPSSSCRCSCPAEGTIGVLSTIKSGFIWSSSPRTMSKTEIIPAFNSGGRSRVYRTKMTPFSRASLYFNSPAP